MLASIVSLFLAAASPAPDPSAAAAALARLRALAGEWQGPLEWTGARTGKGTVTATYSITGGGSAVVEDLVMEGVRSMTSVYHLDGADLRMTHYCGAQNQPRLKARNIDLARGAVDFDFVDATNLSSPQAAHVYGVELRFVDPDHFVLTFLFVAGAQRSREQLTLARVQTR